MKNVAIIIIYCAFSISAFGQENNLKRNEINSILKFTDSICKNRNEGIAEGKIIYNHIKGNYGWEAYFLNNSENKNNPLRIRYFETKPKINENINLFYSNGILIFAELITTRNRRKSKNNKTIKKQFYFDGKVIISPDLIDSDIDYLIEKEKTIRKMIY